MKSIKEYVIKHWAVIIVSLALLFGLAIVIAPHIWMGMYNVPGGDDFSFAQINHEGLTSGGIPGLIKSMVYTPVHWSEVWECRWACSFTNGLNPFIFGEKYYHLVAPIVFLFMTLGAFGFMLLTFGRDRESLIYLVPAVLLFLIILVLYTPSVTMGFYWWTGVAAYVIPFWLSVVYLGALIRIASSEKQVGKKSIPWVVVLGILSLYLGGNNFSACIMVFSALLAIWGMTILLTVVDKKPLKSIKNTNIVFAIMLACQLVGIVLTIISPSLKTQLDSRADGEVNSGLVSAVINSVVDTVRFLGQLLDIKLVLSVLICIPFGILNGLKTKLKFRMPVLVSVLSLLVMAASVSVNIYVSGDAGGGYALNVRYYGCMITILANVIYWTGYITGLKPVRKVLSKVYKSKLLQPGVLVITGVLGLLLAGYLYVKDLKILSSYQAYNYVNNGWSQQYAAEWEERFEVLNDPSVDRVVFEPIHTYGGYIQMYDLYESDSVAYWINMAVAEYYGKKSVDIKVPDNINEY